MAKLERWDKEAEIVVAVTGSGGRREDLNFLVLDNDVNTEETATGGADTEEAARCFLVLFNRVLMTAFFRRGGFFTLALAARNGKSCTSTMSKSSFSLLLFLFRLR